MRDLAAKQGVVVQLRIQGPRKLGLDHHRPVALRDVRVAVVVQGVCALNPAWELPAHHRLRDGLCGRAGLVTRLPGHVAPTGALRIETSGPAVRTQQRKRLPHFSVVQVPADQRSGSTHPCGATALVTHGGGNVGDYLYQLSIPFKLYLEKRQGKLTGGMTEGV